MKILLALTFNLLATATTNAEVCEAHMSRAAQQHKVPLAILYAVGLSESGVRDRLHPHALNVEGDTYFPESRRAAERIVQKARKDGRRLIDIGCMQINLHYHRNSFSSLQAMFDPVQNVDYAATFLRQLKNRHKSWVMAVARYHAGPDNNRAQRRYVCRVLNHMIKQGLAKHTRSSRKICNIR